MTEHIIKTDKNGDSHIIVKFHAPVKHFKRVEKFKYQDHFYNIYVNNRNCVHRLERSKVISWKEIVKGGRKIRIPDVCETILEPTLMNKIRGNSYEVAIQRIMTEIEKENILS